MHDEFAPLLALYDCCGPEAKGHGAVEVAGDEAELVERFVAGICNASERRQVAQFLQSHPELIRPIADRIKANRQTSETTTPETTTSSP